MKALLIVSTLITLLQGCTVMTPEEAQEARNAWARNAWSANTATATDDRLEQSKRGNKDYLYYYITHSFSGADIENDSKLQKNKSSGVQTESMGYGHKYAFNGEKSLILSEVVSKMAEQLLYNYGVQYRNEAIALTSLVDLNNHKSTNWLGQTISEQFIHELHIRNLRVVDFKLMGSIQVTENGEFGMTRDWAKLKKDVNVTRILTGTMSRNEEGIILNVRIVNANNNVVESTSSAFIPHTLFVGGVYEYGEKKYISRSTREENKSLVRLVK
jgi:TolB-like protein